MLVRLRIIRELRAAHLQQLTCKAAHAENILSVSGTPSKSRTCVTGVVKAASYSVERHFKHQRMQGGGFNFTAGSHG